jgi:multiple sugar transport system permease protein
MKSKNGIALKIKKQLEWYTFIIATIICLIVLVYVPMISTINYSMYDVSFLGYGEKFVGLKNYNTLILSKSFIHALSNTIILTILSLVTIPIGFILASLINGIKNRKLQSFFRVGFYIPNIITGVSVILVFQVILKSDGLLNNFLSFISGQNIAIGWFSDSHYAKFGATILYLWMNLGYSMLINLSSMQSISAELYEAAEIDGADSLRKWSYITIPLMKNCFSFLLVTGVIQSLSRFTDLFIIGGNSSSGAPGGSLQTLLMYIYQYSFDNPKYGLSCAGAIILFVLVFIFSLLNVKISGMLKEENA